MQVQLLISLVHERRAIYDPSDPLYRNRDAIAALWNDNATTIIYNFLYNIAMREEKRIIQAL